MLAGALALEVVAIDALAFRVREQLPIGAQVVLLLKVGVLRKIMPPPQSSRRMMADGTMPQSQNEMPLMIATAPISATAMSLHESVTIFM